MRIDWLARMRIRWRKIRRPQRPVGGIQYLEERVLLTTFVVDSTLDTVDANPGDGVAADAMGRVTLRAAVQEANALPLADSITLPTGTFLLSRFGSSEQAAASGDLDITDTLTITGAGAGFRFFTDNKFVFETTLCFHCANFSITLLRDSGHWGFDAEGSKAKKLLRRLQEICPAA